MQITRQSMFTGKTHTLDLPVTQEQIDRWKGGELVQNVFPHLTADQREFLMTGVTADEWAETFDESCEDCGEHYDDCPCGTDPDEYPEEDDVWADADTLASAGWGTDEDYGGYGDGCEDW